MCVLCIVGVVHAITYAMEIVAAAAAVLATKGGRLSENLLQHQATWKMDFRIYWKACSSLKL